VRPTHTRTQGPRYIKTCFATSASSIGAGDAANSGRLEGSFGALVARLARLDDSENDGGTTEQLSELGAELAPGDDVDDEVVGEDELVQLRRDRVDAIGEAQARPQRLDAPRRHLAATGGGADQPGDDVRHGGAGRQDDVEQRHGQQHRRRHRRVACRRRRVVTTYIHVYIVG